MTDPGDRHTSPEDYAARRPMLLAAIADTEATIQASDTKASIALVIHGLMISGVLSLVTELDSSFDSGADLYRVLVVALLALIVVLFVLSVSQLLRCVMPVPARLFSGIKGGHDVFFIEASADPLSGAVQGLPSVATVHGDLVSLDQGELEEDLVVELVKVSAVRARKVALVGNGLRWLALEIGVGVLFLVSVAIDSIA